MLSQTISQMSGKDCVGALCTRNATCNLAVLRSYSTPVMSNEEGGSLPKNTSPQQTRIGRLILPFFLMIRTKSSYQKDKKTHSTIGSAPLGIESDLVLNTSANTNLTKDVRAGRNSIQRTCSEDESPGKSEPTNSLPVTNDLK